MTTDGVRLVFSAVEADVALRSETDAQQWANGLQLANLTARADAALTVRLECDIAARLDPKKLKLALEPTVKGLKLDLQAFTLKGDRADNPATPAPPLPSEVNNAPAAGSNASQYRPSVGWDARTRPVE